MSWTKLDLVFQISFYIDQNKRNFSSTHRTTHERVWNPWAHPLPIIHEIVWQLQVQLLSMSSSSICILSTILVVSCKFGCVFGYEFICHMQVWEPSMSSFATSSTVHEFLVREPWVHLSSTRNITNLIATLKKKENKVKTIS